MTTSSKRNFIGSLAKLLVGAAAAVLLGACGKTETETAAPPAPARLYVVGTDAAYAPFESQNEKGEIVGFSVDLLDAIAARGGFAVKYVNTPWEGIFNSLAQADRDLLISSITITDERRGSMDFSDAYFDAAQLIAVKQGSKVSRFDDLKTLIVGVQTGTTGDEVVTRLQGKNSTRVKRFESTPLALEELQAGGVDAVVADNGVVVHYVANHADKGFTTVSDAAFVPEQYGIAVKKGNTALLERINAGLAAVRADGSYARIHARYFGAAAAAAPQAAASK